MSFELSDIGIGKRDGDLGIALSKMATDIKISPNRSEIYKSTDEKPSLTLPHGSAVFSGLAAGETFIPVTVQVLEGNKSIYTDANGKAKTVIDSDITVPKPALLTKDGKTKAQDRFGAEAAQLSIDSKRSIVGSGGVLTVQINNPLSPDGTYPATTGLTLNGDTTTTALVLLKAGLAEIKTDKTASSPVNDAGKIALTEYQQAQRNAQENSEGKWSDPNTKTQQTQRGESLKKKRDSAFPNRTAMLNLKADKKNPVAVQEFADIVKSLWNKNRGKNKSVGDDYFKIGDVVLEIPPTHINVSQMRTSYSIPMLGNEAKPITSSHSRTIIKINTIFAEGQIDTDLKRIITQFKYCPFNLVKSKDLFERIVSDNSWLGTVHYSTNSPNTIPVTMDSYTIYTIEGHPFTVGCTLQFSLFNYSPYFDGGTTRMEYYKFTDDRFTNFESMATTCDLENALHPYNMDIEDVLNNKNHLYGLPDYSEGNDKSMVHFFKVTSILTQEMFKDGDILDITKFSDNLSKEIFSIEAHSVSVQYHNNFAWAPIIGHGTPTAQYTGPGESYVSLSFKTDRNELVSSLLKSYNYKIEKDAFSFFDDRYMIKTAMTTFANTEVCSMKELSTSSIQGHPGWTDVNIMFNKNTFNSDLIESNPAAEFDPYWGMKRVLAGLNDPVIDNIVKKTIAEAAIRVPAGSILDRIDNAGNKSGIHTSAETTADMNKILTFFAKSSNQALNNAVDTSHGTPQLSVIQASNTSNIGPTEQSLVTLAESFGDWIYSHSEDVRKKESVMSSEMFGNSSARDPFTRLDTLWKNYPSFALEIYNVLFTNNKPEATTRIASTSISQDGTWTDKAARDKVQNAISANMKIIKSYFNPTYVYIKRGELIKLQYTSGDSKTSYQVGSLIADIIGVDGNIKRKTRSQIKNAAGIEIPSDWPKFTVQSVDENGSVVMACAHIWEDSSSGAALRNQAEIAKETKITTEEQNLKELNPASIKAAPHAGHRYYPGYYNFVKYSAIESASVGDWFVSDAKKGIEKKLSAISESINGAISPVVDQNAWTSVYCKQKLLGGVAVKELEDNPNNPLKFLEIITRPTSRKDAKRIRGDNVSTEMQPFPDRIIQEVYKGELYKQPKSSVNGEFAQDPNDVPYSGLSQMLLHPGTTDKVKVIAGRAMDSFRDYKINQIYGINDEVQTNDGDTDGRIGSRTNMHGTKSSLMVVANGKLKCVGDATVDELNPLLTPVLGSAINLDSSLERKLKCRTIWPEQDKLAQMEINPAMSDTFVKMDKANVNYDRVPSTLTNSTSGQEEEERKKAEDLKKNSEDKILDSDQIWAVINKAMSNVGLKDTERDENVYSTIEKNFGFPWTLYTKDESISIVETILKRAFTILGDGVMDGASAARDLRAAREGMATTLSPASVQLAEQYLATFDIVLPNKTGGIFGIAATEHTVLPVKDRKEEIFVKTAKAIWLARKNSAEHGVDFNQFAIQNSVAQDSFPLQNNLNLNNTTLPINTQPNTKWFLKVKKGQNYFDSVNTGNKELAEDLSKIAENTRTFLSQQMMIGMMSTTGLQNAFPTFKLYLISSDTSEYKFYSLDDYYDFRLMQDVMVIRTKNSPAHILKARILVDPRYITIDGIPQQKGDDRTMPAEHRNTLPGAQTIDGEGEKYFSMGRCPLRTGMRICLKLGYHTDPRMLDTVFIGTVLGINGSMETGIYEIEAQGDGRELLGSATVESQSLSGINLREIVTKMLRSNASITHFGRTYGTAIEKFSREHYILMALGRAGLGSSAFLGLGGVATVATGFMIPCLWPVMALGAIGGAAYMFNYSPIPEMQGRLIEDMKVHYGGSRAAGFQTFGHWLKGSTFDPEKAGRQAAIAVHESLSYGHDPIDDNIRLFDIWPKAEVQKFQINNSMITWDVLKVIMRLYPGWAIDVRPYGNRSTIFAGPVEDYYWRTDDPIVAMGPQLNENSNVNLQHNDKIRAHMYNFMDRDSFGGIATTDKNAKQGAHFIPFQKQFVVSSEADIIMNGIKSTPDRGFNNVIINYSKASTPKERLLLDQGLSSVLTMCANEDIEMGARRTMVASLDWTGSETIATQYAASLLKEGVEKMYGGTLIIRGNSKIEPYDKIYIADKINKMFGWIEVETVIHKIDQNMGYTTHIVPNMVCAINKDVYMTRSAMWHRFIFNKLSKIKIESIGGALLGYGATEAATAGITVVATIFGISNPLGWAMLGIGALVTAVSLGSAFYDELQKYVPGDSQVANGHDTVMNIMDIIIRSENVINFAILGWTLGSIKKTWKELKVSKNPLRMTVISGGKSVGRGVVTAYLRTQTMLKTRSFVKDYTQLAASEKIQSIPKIKKALSDPGYLEKLIAEAKAKYPGSKEIDDLEAKLVSTRKDIAAAEVKAKTKGSFKKVSGKFGLPALRGVGKIAGRGTAGFFMAEAVSFIPMALETVMFKSMTKAAVLTISPLWSRNSLLMGGLDGWKNEDAYMHTQGIVLNAKRAIDEAVSSITSFTSLPFENGPTLSIDSIALNANATNATVNSENVRLTTGVPMSQRTPQSFTDARGVLHDITGWATSPEKPAAMQRAANKLGIVSAANIEEKARQFTPGVSATALMNASIRAKINVESIMAHVMTEAYENGKLANVPLKNNNYGGLTWTPKTDKLYPASTKGTPRPASEGGNYVRFLSQEEGLLQLALLQGRKDKQIL